MSRRTRKPRALPPPAAATLRRRSFAGWLTAHAGRRGAFLGFLTLLDFVLGYSLLTIPALPVHLDMFLPLRAWGWAWIGAGAVCASGVLARRDIIQYMVAAGFKGLWGLLYLDFWLVQHMPMGWVSAVVWLAFSATVVLIAGWPEQMPVLPEIEVPR